MNRWFYIVLFVIVGIGVGLRLYKVNAPIADWHSWRQVDTAAVARNFERFGLDPLHPRYDDLSNIQSGKDNPEGWRMVEFPLYQIAGVLLRKTIPTLSIEVALRLVSIASSAGTIILLGLLMQRLVSPIAGIFTSFFYALIPYSVFYSRTVLPESTAVFFVVLSIYLAVNAFEKKGLSHVLLLLISATAAACAILVKPFAGFFLLPILGLFVWHRSFSIGFLIRVVLYGVIAFLPFYLWRQWIIQFPEGIAVYTWLFNEGNIRLKGAWFYWLFAERIGKLILGYWGSLFLSLGLIAESGKKEQSVPRLLLVGSLLYVVIVARGNVQHDYYQVFLLPMLAVFLGKGASLLAQRIPHTNSVMRWGMGIVCVLFMFSFSWYYIRTNYWINHPEIVEAGMQADQLLPTNAKVIAPYNGDTTFLYQTRRQGWPIGFEIEKKIAMGATHYVTVSASDNDGETKDLASRYTVLVRNERFAIIDLTKPIK